MGAAAIIRATAVLPCGLPLWVQGMDVHGEVQLASDHLLVFSGELIGAVYTFGVPIGPIKTVLEDRDGKWMRKTLVNHCFAVGSVKICSLNDMVFGVHPVHASPSIIDGQSIGPEEMSIGNDAPV